MQRQRQTLAGLLAGEERDAILQIHRNAQRLLQPLNVVNPYADQLTFLDDKTRTRRDHMKYLSLIRTITFLHQYQREIKTVPHRGKLVRYIEVTPDDIAIANRLAHDVLGRTLDELPPQTRKLLSTLHAWVKSDCERQSLQQADFRFSRRQVRDLTGWGNTQLGIHLARLVDMEYLFEHGGRRGQTSGYELAYGGEGESGHPFLMGLLDSETLDAHHKSTPMTANVRGGKGEDTGSKRPENGGVSAPVRSGVSSLQANNGAAFDQNEDDHAPNAYINGTRNPSYRTSIAPVDA